MFAGETELLILQREWRGESGVLVHGVSPSRGRLVLTLPGTASPKGKGHDGIDLFTQVRIDLQPHPKRSSFMLVKDVHVLRCFRDLGASFERLQSAASIARFTLAHCHENDPAPLHFSACLRSLAWLEAGGHVAAARTLMHVAHLASHGSMPSDGLSPTQVRLLEKLLLACADETQPMPNLSDEQWCSLDDWSRQLLIWADLDAAY
jgi:recombinational DNA repair protein (RecF pathway)